MRKVVSMLVAVLMLAGLVHARCTECSESSSANGVTVTQSVWVNPGGLGDVLLYPYYNARDNYLSFVRLVNTSDMTVVAKVRLREGYESRELADFVVCLSPHDQFSFWISYPQLFGYDSDRVIIIRGGDDTGVMGDTDTVVLPNNWKMIDAYNAENSGVTDMNRSFEGYVEVFGIKAYPSEFANMDAALCRELSINNEYKGVAAVDVPNALMGEMFIFDLNSPYKTYAYKAVALADFATAPLVPQNSVRGWLGTEDPTLSDANGGLVALNVALAKTKLYALFNLTGFYSGGTDIIMNFITKKAIIDAIKAGDLSANYTDYYLGCAADPTKDYTTCCVPFDAYLFDDKEHLLIEFSPAGRKACKEISYVPINLRSRKGSSLICTELKDSKSEIVIPEELTPPAFKMGWLMIDFRTPDGKQLYEPVLAYEVQGFLNEEFSHFLPVSYSLSNKVPTPTPNPNPQPAPYSCDQNCGSDIGCIVWQGVHCK